MSQTINWLNLQNVQSYATMRNTVLTVLVLASFLVSGCDMFRKLAGRPTAEEIDRMRIEMMAEKEAAHQARIDSLRSVERMLADSLAILDSLKQMRGTILNPSDMGGMFTTKLGSRYYIVVGSFLRRANAESLFSEVQARGYTPVLVNFRNGFNSVAIAPADNLRQVMESLKAVKTEPFCPDDVWILVNE